MSVTCIPHLYSNSGVCGGRPIPIFLIFAQKHRLWVLLRTASLRRFQCVPTIYILSKDKKNIKIFLLKFFIFLKLKKNLHITWACFRNEQSFKVQWIPMGGVYTLYTASCILEKRACCQL